MKIGDLVVFHDQPLGIRVVTEIINEGLFKGWIIYDHKKHALVPRNHPRNVSPPAKIIADYRPLSDDDFNPKILAMVKEFYE